MKLPKQAREAVKFHGMKSALRAEARRLRAERRGLTEKIDKIEDALTLAEDVDEIIDGIPFANKYIGWHVVGWPKSPWVRMFQPYLDGGIQSKNWRVIVDTPHPLLKGESTFLAWEPVSKAEARRLTVDYFKRALDAEAALGLGSSK